MYVSMFEYSVVSIQLMNYGSAIKAIPHSILYLGFYRYTNKTALLSAIDGVAYYGGELKNLLAGSIIWTSVFHLDFGDRLIVPNVIMWITDGIPLIADEPGDALSNAYQTLGIKVLVVCITPGCDERMAKGEASPPKKVRHI